MPSCLSHRVQICKFVFYSHLSTCTIYAHSSLQDYLYKYTDTLAFNVYYGCCSSLDPKALSRLWRKHKPGLLEFLIMPSLGVKGKQSFISFVTVLVSISVVG